MNLKLSIRVVVSRLFAENCFIASREGDSRCVIIDPGLEVEHILSLLTEFRLSPTAILLTHGHADHIAGVETLKRCFPLCPVVIGRLDAPKLTDANLNLSSQYGFDLVAPPADQLVDQDDHIEFAGLEFEVLYTPGHSVGHVVYLWKGGAPWIVFGGDVLFREGVGRTDFPDGDSQQLVDSIVTRLFTLPADTVVYPGHGPSTTIGYEQEENPFVGRAVREARPSRFR